MGTRFLVVVVAVVVFCRFAKVFADQNPIRLVSDRSFDDDDLDLPFISSVGIDAIYQFGDSISDTGNLIRVDPTESCGKWPYGQTFFHRPTGRCSNGLLMIDYFAKLLNLPLIDPYLNKDGNFTHGVNFAVASSTALDVSTLEENYSLPAVTNLSLSVQLGWFKSHINSFYPDVSERRRKLAKGLFLMGEVGGNDIFFAFSNGITLSDIYKMMSLVVQSITDAVEEIIDLGATQIAIPGNFAIGCMPVYLSLFKAKDANMYDEMKCLKEYNRHAQYYNDLLQQSIIKLQKNHPNVTIVYMDYFGALKEIIENATLLGFDETIAQKACCGVRDSEYNVSVNVCCGSEEDVVCENPEKYISWDGVHFTQHTYRVMANKLMLSFLNALQNVA
ncbi:hypothetical protein vseg_016168 [Gypsophila vaccaria]